MNQITAIIPTFNESDHIAEAIASVHFADEIIVVDSFSDDQTVEIAKSLGVTVVEHEYKHSAAQKNWIIPQAKHEWIFLLDADERVSDQLKNEIKEKLSLDVIPEDAFWIKRSNYFLGKRVKYSGWQGDRVIRLFKRDTCKYQNKHVHAEIETNGSVGALQGRLTHYTFKSMDHYIAKINKYATWKAEQFHHANKRPTLFDFTIKPVFRFFKNYIIDLGFLDGKRGLIISGLNAYGIFLRYAKLQGLRNQSATDQ